MHFIFALYKYFPFGGLQKDTLRMAEEARSRGHHCTFFTTEWQGTPPAQMDLHLVEANGWTNFGKMLHFEKLLKQFLHDTPHDASLAMNRFAGCDWYFVADYCQATWLPHLHSRLMLMLNPRYRAYLAMERRIFQPGSPQKILYITPSQMTEYQKAYGTEPERFFLLPPGMNPACVRPADAEERRLQARQKLGLAKDEILLCNIGANLAVKGGARSLEMFASLPRAWKERCRLLLVGEAGTLPELAQRLGISERCFFPGTSTEVPSFLLASDLMVHPAIQEPTGTILIEGIAAGIPVVCSQVCGFENYVRAASGRVVPEPFSPERFRELTIDALQHLPELTRLDREYAAKTDFTSRARVAIDLLEHTHDTTWLASQAIQLRNPNA